MYLVICFRSCDIEEILILKKKIKIRFGDQKAQNE